MKFLNKHEEGSKNHLSAHAGHRGRLRGEFIRNKFVEVDEHVLMEYIVQTIIPRKNTNNLAHDLINSFGSVANVCDAEVEDLKKIKGISDMTAHFLHNLPFVFRNYEISKQRPRALLTCAQDILNYIGEAIHHLPQEEFYLICLDDGDHVINRKLVARGSIRAVLVNQNDIIRYACSVNSSKVILVHNHPTTSPDPSGEDVETTKKLFFALKFNNIDLVEHMIVNYQGLAYSFAQDGWISKFEQANNRLKNELF